MVIILMDVADYSIGGYWWLSLVIILVVINGYWWLLMVIILMAIGGYFIGGYCWLLMLLY